MTNGNKKENKKIQSQLNELEHKLEEYKIYREDCFMRLAELTQTVNNLEKKIDELKKLL